MVQRILSQSLPLLHAAVAVLMPLVVPMGPCRGEDPDPGPSRAWSLNETVALAEMSVMAGAEEIVRADTGYYVSLENLDDLSSTTNRATYDYIDDGGGAPVIRPATSRFHNERVELTKAYSRWKGPYVTYQRVRTDYDDIHNYDRGTPLDPWGMPYYLFTPSGLVRPPSAVTLELLGDRFDRYAILSAGSDRQTATADDLVYSFGAPPSVTTLTSVTPERLRTGDTLTLKGYWLGEPGGDRDLLLNGLPAGDGVTTWTQTRIQKHLLAADPVGVVRVSVGSPGGIETASFEVFVEPLPTLSRTWPFYR